VEGDSNLSKNTYDKHDMVSRGACLIAGPMKIAEYRVRDPETGEWSTPQFHFTYNNTVMAVMGEQAAILFANFVASALDRTFAPTPRNPEGA
jgi:hypothetical protein